MQCSESFGALVAAALRAPTAAAVTGHMLHMPCGACSWERRASRRKSVLDEGGHGYGGLARSAGDSFGQAPLIMWLLPGNFPITLNSGGSLGFRACMHGSGPLAAEGTPPVFSRPPDSRGGAGHFC